MEELKAIPKMRMLGYLDDGITVENILLKEENMKEIKEILKETEIKYFSCSHGYGD